MRPAPSTANEHPREDTRRNGQQSVISRVAGGREEPVGRVIVHESGTGKGPLTLDRLRDAAASGEIETVVVGFTDHYGRLMGKR